MDGDLWVSLDLILTFPRMRALGVKDAARVAALLDARAPDIEVDAVAGRIRPAWALRSNLVLKDVHPAATDADIAALLRVPFASNPMLRPVQPQPLQPSTTSSTTSSTSTVQQQNAPVSDTAAPHFSGLISVMQVAETAWIAIFDKPTGAADALPVVNGQHVRGRAVSASMYVEGLEPQNTPYAPTVFQALPNPYAAAVAPPLPPPLAPPPSSPTATDGGISFPTDAPIYPYAYMPYPVAPSPVDHAAVSHMFIPPHHLPPPVPAAAAASSLSPPRASPGGRANGSQQHRANGQMVNGHHHHRRAQHANGRTPSQSHNQNQTQNQIQNQASNQNQHGSVSAANSNDQSRSPQQHNGRRPRRMMRRPAHRHGSSTEQEGTIQNPAPQIGTQAETQAQNEEPHQDPTPDVSTMHFPPLQSPAGRPNDAMSGSTQRAETPVSPVVQKSSKDSSPVSNVSSLTTDNDVTQAPLEHKEKEKEREKTVTSNNVAAVPKSYAAILRSKPASSKPASPKTFGSKSGQVNVVPAASEGSVSSPSASGSESGAFQSPAGGEIIVAAANGAVAGKGRRPPKSPSVWASKPLSVVKPGPTVPMAQTQSSTWTSSNGAGKASSHGAALNSSGGVTANGKVDTMTKGNVKQTWNQVNGQGGGGGATAQAAQPRAKGRMNGSPGSSGSATMSEDTGATTSSKVAASTATRPVTS